MAADVDSGQDIQVIDLVPNASGDRLTVARQMFQQGQIVRVVGGTREDVDRLLQITLSESSAKARDLASQVSAGNSDQAKPSPEPAAIAVRLTGKGSLHEYVSFNATSNSTDSSADTRFWQWVDEEREKAKQDQDPGLQSSQLGDPPPVVPQAWSEINQITNSTTNDDGISQIKLSIYRLVEFDSGGDWYMVLLDPVAGPNGQCASNSVAAKCLHVTLNRSFTLSATGADIHLVDHGPTATITTSNAELNLGFNLSPSGPSGSIGFKQTWAQPSVTTVDQTNIGTGIPAWHETFYFGNPIPATMYSSFVSHQGAIFQVPENTAGFNLSVLTETDFGNCGQVFQNAPVCNMTSAADVNINTKVAAPVLSITPSQVQIAPGGTAKLQLTASIASSTIGVPWLISNVPNWLTVSQTSGTTSTTLTLSADPKVAIGTVGSLNLNTGTPYAAPSVERGPIVIPVTVASTQANTTTTISSNVNPSNVGQTVTFQAHVTSTSGTPTPTGVVNFLDGGTVLGSGTLVSGTAVFPTSSLTAGSHVIVASYAGNSDFGASQSVPYTQTISSGPSGKVTPIVDLTVNGSSSNATVAAGATVTFAARIHAASGYPWPDGSITVSDSTNASNIYGSANVTKDPNSNDGLATIVTTGIAPGSYSLVVTYGGDNQGLYYNGARSNTVSLTVQQSLGGSPGQPSLSFVAIPGRRTDSRMPIFVTVKNNGSTPAEAVTVDRIALNTVAGSRDARLISPSLPVVIGQLSPGATTVLKLELYVPNTATRLSLAEIGTFQDTSGTVYQFDPGQVIFP
jgi:hypothetical protein